MDDADRRRVEAVLAPVISAEELSDFIDDLLVEYFSSQGLSSEKKPERTGRKQLLQPDKSKKPSPQ